MPAPFCPYVCDEWPAFTAAEVAPVDSGSDGAGLDFPRAYSDDAPRPYLRGLYAGFFEPATANRLRALSDSGAGLEAPALAESNAAASPGSGLLLLGLVALGIYAARA